MRRLVLRSVAALTLGPAAGVDASPQEPPAFPSEVEVVRLDVTAVRRDGQPATDLTAADFEVAEKGRPREIVTFLRVLLPLDRSPEPPAPTAVSAPVVRQPEDGRCFLVFFDDVHVSPPVSEWLRASLAPFLERAVKDGDVVTVVAPEERLFWTARTPWEHRKLPEVVRRLAGRLVRDPFSDEASQSDWVAMMTVEYRSRTGADVASRQGQEVPAAAVGTPGPLHAEMTYAVAMRRIRHTLGALREAIQSIAPFRGRKSLFLVSEGFIRAPRIRGLYDDVIATARRAGVVVHYVAPQGLGIDGKIGERYLETMAAGSVEIATETGGRSFATNDLEEPFREVLEESSSYYLLGIHPLDARPGEHRVKVKVRRRDVTIVARTRYVLAAAGDEGVAAATARALRSAFDETAVPLRVWSEVRATDGRGPAEVAFSIALDPGTGERRLRLLLVARTLAGGEPVTESGEAAVGGASGPTVRRLLLEPGTWQVRVVATDVTSGSLGSVFHTLEVPASRR